MSEETLYLTKRCVFPFGCTGAKVELPLVNHGAQNAFLGAIFTLENTITPFCQDRLGTNIGKAP